MIDWEIVAAKTLIVIAALFIVGVAGTLIFGCPRLVWAPESTTGRYQVIITTAGVVQSEYITNERNGDIYCIRGNYLLPDGTMFKAAETTSVMIKPINEQR